MFLAVIFVLVLAAILTVFFMVRHNVNLTTEMEWSIGIYSGTSYARFTDQAHVHNPVITRTDVTDVNASFVADPFIMRTESAWYMFFEVFDSLAGKGVIGLSESGDGLQWTYKGIVLREGFHLSYPYVFNADGICYMIPESARAGCVRLYRATQFPYTWQFAGSLLEGDFCDASVIKYNGLWWMFTCTDSKAHNELKVFHSESIFGPWISHPGNPIVAHDPSRARPGGRMLIVGDGILRFAQNDAGTYGKAVRAFLVTRLTTTAYEEVAVQPDPVLSAAGRGWTRHGMHHIDALELEPGVFLAAVDGYKKNLKVRLEY